MIIREWHDASYVFYSIRQDAGELLSPLIAAMEKSMTFRLGERGLIEEDIPVGCSLHPHFNINCSDCRRVFQERGRIRPFLFRFPDERGGNYLLGVPLGLVPLLLKRDYPLPPPMRDSMGSILEDVDAIRRRAVIDPKAQGVPPTVKLKPQHIDAIQRALLYWRCIIRGIPGAGKTWVAIGLLSSLSPTLRICWLTHTNALLNQSARGKKRKGSRSPLESETGIIREIAEMTQHQFTNIITTCVNYASDAITSDPHNENHQRLAVSLTNFLNMLLVLPSKGEALGWVMNTSNIRGLLASWLALLYSVGLATAVTETPTAVVPDDNTPDVRRRRRIIAENIKEFYTVDAAVSGSVNEILGTIARNIDMATDILAHAINNPTDIVRAMIEPQHPEEQAQKFAQLMQAKLPQILQNPYLATVAGYVFYPAIEEWGMGTGWVCPCEGRKRGHKSKKPCGLLTHRAEALCPQAFL